MNFELTEDQKMIRDMVRDFAKKYVEPGILDRDASMEFPHDLVAQLADQGLMGMVYPEEYGGAGVDTISFALAIEELARYDGSLALTVASHTSLCTGHIAQFGSKELKDKYMPDLVSATKLGGWGLTEAGSGSDASGMKTTAVLDGDHWIINGGKLFITQGSVGKTFVILAVTDRSLGNKGISAFVLESDMPGFSVGEKMDKLGMRSSDTRELVFENVKVPKENLVGELNHGFIDTMKVLEGGRIGIGALAVGLARGALEDSITHAKERVQFGKPISKLQAIQFKIAEMATDLEGARLLVHQAAYLKDQGKSFGVEASTAKYHASEVGMKICSDGIQILGGYGYMEEYHVERYYRDMKLCEIGEGTSEVQKMVIAKSMLK
ncbi:MAG: acyl-CoA dehydrogenase family protein [Candidatus Cloacimonetes bacterium]|nr:acyl-CoA dehydrogenase family protein [Candidatus Cloacimonadota bacterium]